MSKIESGTMAIEVADYPFAELWEYVERTFRPMAETKGLALAVDLAAGLPKAISTDARRLQQVLRNLLSNACKFTETGRVEMVVKLATAGWSADHPVLGRTAGVVAFSVSDTGIGIAANKLKIIFEPFQQADTGTGRMYGGTGLGLSISREIARLLGGEIRVRSTPGQGSTFTLYLPLAYLPPGHRRQAESPAESAPERARPGAPGTGARLDAGPPAADLRRTAGIAGRLVIPQMDVGGDRDDLQPGDRLVLIVEHDPRFASILLEMAHQSGFKGLITSRGEMALELAQSTNPDAITLDLRLPDMAGWVVLDRLKHHPSTSHIPVHVISGDESFSRGVKRGALRRASKAGRPEGTQGRVHQPRAASLRGGSRRSWSSRITRSSAATSVTRSPTTTSESPRSQPGPRPWRLLKTQSFDCVVVDLGLPDMPGLDADRVSQERPYALHNVPLIVYTGKDLTPGEQAQLENVAESVITKDARSMERLLGETTLFLHRLEKDLSPAAKEAVEQFRRSDEGIAHKQVLIVDDDVRNIFALTSMLEHWEMNVRAGRERPRKRLEILGTSPDIDVVLMDIMMPGMDGYETTRAHSRAARVR